MEQNALLFNIATILTEDILVDETKLIRQPNHLMHTIQPDDQDAPSFPLLQDDDEAFTFFLKQQSLLDNKLPQKRSAGRAPNAHQPKEKHRKQHPCNDTVATAEKDLALEVNLLNEFDNNSFESYLHLSKATFLKIFKSLRLYVTRAALNSSDVSPQTVFSLALWKLTTDEHFEEISRRFQMPLHSCHFVIRRFWHLISENYESFIKWPNSHPTQQANLSDFQALSTFQVFRGLFGIIAIKRLDIFLESKDEEISVILQIICNAKEKIIDCFVEFANEYSFDCTPIGQTLDLNAQTIPVESYIIGDCSFPLKRFLMRPFEIECFRNETVFNRLLQPALAMGQHVLDDMAQRFHTLYALEAKDISEVRKVLETVCSLHNLCVDHKDCYVSSRQSAMNAANVKPIPSISAIKGSEHNQHGRKARLELMEQIVR